MQKSNINDTLRNQINLRRETKWVGKRERLLKKFKWLQSTVNGEKVNENEV